MINNSILTEDLVKTVCDQYLLDLDGIHGLAHWARVYDNGLVIADNSGADRDVVELFALFHDACRKSDGGDYLHGTRGAALAAELRHDYFDLDDDQFDLLHSACCLHTKDRTHHEVTVQTCFDADRLDLGRVGNRPDPYFLSTQHARQKQMMKWAYGRSVSGFHPDNIISPKG